MKDELKLWKKSFRNADWKNIGKEILVTFLDGWAECNTVILKLITLLMVVLVVKHVTGDDLASRFTIIGMLLFFIGIAWPVFRELFHSKFEKYR